MSQHHMQFRLQWADFKEYDKYPLLAYNSTELHSKPVYNFGDRTHDLCH
jgi:hypothetical protein